ncbi:MAG: 4-(cytidine 5'-diphospho)-2-C-methyl-D-erythritol kinase [Spirochaetales bacterium]|nr:4-(cytidine 5'-diphospho)-2-C-methyl-D-erythritol kinase [Spirochaetales bacterium]
MKHALELRAPAKINLHLAIGGRRPDGFHEIASLFQAVSLYDSIRLELVPENTVSVDATLDCPAEKNTAWLAATAFFAAAANRAGDALPGVRISIEKKIPAGAGLGGGSSDAATVLAGLAALLPGRVEPATLRSIAAEVGSDVPFFLLSACAAVTGRGEFVRPVSGRVDYAVLLVEPGFSINTARAYALLDAARANMAHSAPPTADLDFILDEYHRRDPGQWPFRNDFYDALLPDYPGLEPCRATITSTGASFVSMSGSGSTVYGVYPSTEAAQRAERVVSRLYSAHVAFPLARLPVSI